MPTRAAKMPPSAAAISGSIQKGRVWNPKPVTKVPTPKNAAVANEM